MQENLPIAELPLTPLFLEQHQTLSTTLGDLIAYWLQKIPQNQSGLVPLSFSDETRPVTVLIAIGPESIEKVLGILKQ